MAITPDQIGEAVIKAIPGFFNDAIDQLRQGEGAYLRDGMPEGIVGQIGQAVGRSACRQYAAQGPDAVGSKGERFERACRPYLESLNPGDGIQFETPFVGGQCDAQVYLGSYTGNVGNIPPGTSRTVFFKAFGPIGGVVTTGDPGSQTTGLRCRGALQREGTPFTCSGIGPTLGASRVVNFFSGGTQKGFSVDGVSPCGLDNCGNPPPIVVPPVERPDPTPPPFVFNPGPDINIPINVDLQPDGTINVDFGDGPRTVDPFPEDEPSGGGGGSPGDPTDPGSPGGGGDTGLGGDAAGEAGEDEELVGVLVEVLQAPQNPNVFANNSDQPFRGIGYVRMGYPDRLGTDISGGTVISPQFFHAQQRGLTNWAVSANTGFNLRTTPYYRSIEVNV